MKMKIIEIRMAVKKYIGEFKGSVSAAYSVLGIISVLGWWGYFYPQLAMTPDTYRIVSEDGTVQMEAEVLEWDFDDDIYMEILNADRDHVRFRSRLFQAAADYLESFHKE